MKILIAFPLVMVLCLGGQVACEHATRATAIQSALDACYDAPDTTDEECEAWADSGYVWPGVQ